MKARGETLDACLVGEPTSSKAVGDEIKIGRRGSVNAELIVHGKQGHAAYGAPRRQPRAEARAHDRPAVHRRRSMPAREQFQPSSVEATVVSVPNTATNVIPASARANFNIRYNDLHTRAEDRGLGATSIARRRRTEVGARFSLTLRGHAATCS